MSEPTNDPKSGAADQRDALMESQRKAHEKQPENLKEQASADKLVEIKPDPSGKAPMDGLDSK